MDDLLSTAAAINNLQRSSSVWPSGSVPYTTTACVSLGFQSTFLSANYLHIFVYCVLLLFVESNMAAEAGKKQTSQQLVGTRQDCRPLYVKNTRIQRKGIELFCRPAATVIKSSLHL